ncbi:Glycosyltransferase subfamily 4-like, N-terminal domain protein [Acididesulfobacillus acetoxydans]|uniref:Glycosyl transferases group 1 protein n=1 Tax=Acididesulfobacillus acetoxydans TaxID=1561005 RepID=A0A8S0WWJ7_9FIRM|nr:glycosyltransferase family 4 protein [Acididesulfobacillus acetoxydans]CAA7600331.1 Glycosyltransferase subfamily 4-like, N-terminal domain protein [Acididesulfobacillus acetoxydans]CEJ06107.1 Glycosyl transferases group 1 protein [Acididesulfobacillus acetoxydans]
MKVLYLTNEYAGERFGGAGSSVTGMVRMFWDQGVRPTVVAPQSGRVTAGWEMLPEGLKILWLPRQERYFGNLGLIDAFSVLGEFPELREGWDLIHIHAVNFAPLAYAVAKNRVPLLYSVPSLLRVELANDPAPELQAQFEVQEELLARAALIHLVSYNERQHLERRFPWLRVRTAVVSLGIVSREVCWQGGRGNSLLYVGRLIEYKGIEDLLKALILVWQERPGVTLEVVGRGSAEYEQRLKTLIPWPARVRFQGWEESQDRIAERMARSSLLVVPSRRESFGLVALEGMAVGVPLITSDAGALKELASPSCALTFAAGKVEALAAVIVKALTNPELMRFLAQNAAKRAAALTWTELAPQYLDLYARAIGSNRGRGTAAPR